jgi:hypothetical protein
MFEERRKSRRFEGRIAVVSSDEEGLNFSFIADLSREGAYIETEKLLSVGTLFHFVLTNGTISSPLTGRVMRAKDAFFHGGRSGMGIRFERLDGNVKMIRDDLLLVLMNQRFHHQWEAA